MIFRWLFPALAIAVMLVPPVSAEDDLINADRPGIADGSQVVKRGQFQAELGLQRDHDREDGVDAKLWLTPLLLRYGLTDRMEARVESDAFNRLRTSASGFVSTERGLAPIALGFKYHFLDEVAERHQPSFGVIARVTPPSGSGVFKSQRTAGDVRLAADWTFGKWAVNPNLGAASGHDSSDREFASLLASMTVQYNLSDRLGVFIDGALQSPEGRHAGGSVQTDAGAAWIVTRDTQLDVSAGWRIRGTTVPNVFAGAGVSHRF